MPKPNQKRIEERTQAKNRDNYEPPEPEHVFSNPEVERAFAKLISGQQGYGKNYGKSLRPETP